ncbi:MAG: deoxyribonuclease IV [Oscillospiraceae bacterium]|nr:deoxyribonuclease IV [Oscillospiraceae bacterium]
MLKIGCHLSVSDGFLAMGKVADSIGANTFQYFSRNPRGGAAKAIDKKDIAAFLDFADQHGMGDFLAHAPYTLNLCSDKENIRKFALNTLQDDIGRTENLPGSLYNFHPGSHVGQGKETGISIVSEALSQILRPEQTVTVLLETMSGKGSELGGRFEELREIIDRVDLHEKLGVCLDTCHVHDAGYDIARDLDGVLTEFDRVIGLKRLRAVHINDSKNTRESRKDRHETIGNGQIGLEALARVINHESLRSLPFYLETPNELEGYAQEIALLQGLYIS